jgi:hypothetical protein
LLAGTFLGLELFRLPFHEPWRDEIEAWAIARDAGPLLEMEKTLRYTGHPRLWHLLLFTVSRLSGSIVTLQVLAIVLGAAAMYVVARFCPLSRLQRALFAFGYFPFFEFTAISRFYALTLPLAAGAMAVLCAQRTRPILAAWLLVLLAQTGAYGLILSGAFTLGASIELWFEHRAGRPLPRGTIAAATLIVGGAALAVVQMIPPPDGWWAQSVAAPHPRKFFSAVSTVGRGFFPIPPFTLHFWNHTIVDHQRFILLAITLVVYGGLIVTLWRRPSALAVLLGGSMAIVLFTAARHGSLRHHGHHLLVAFFACWFAQRASVRPAEPSVERVLAPLERFRNPLLTGTLVVGVIGGLMASALDVVYPFSASRAAARWLEHSPWRELPIVGDRDSETGAIAAQLRRPFLLAAGERESTFVRFDAARGDGAAGETRTIALAAELARKRQTDVVLVLNYPLSLDRAGVELLAHFETSVVAQEIYYVYRLIQTQLPAESR